MGNIFGQLFVISTWGESHNGGIGVVIDGCPPKLPISESDIQIELDRRKPGQSSITTQRKESDTVKILSGVNEGFTLGTPIAMLIPNLDARPEAYTEMKEKYRPSHADYTYQMKYGIRMVEGGGRSSARETAGRVAAGAVAKKILKLALDIEIIAYVEQVHSIIMPSMEKFPTIDDVDRNDIRCPDQKTATKMISKIKEIQSKGDSLGGVIKCRIKNLPTGLGEPVFDRLEADLAKAMLSLPATKGFDVGSGFSGTSMTGSEHNDIFEIGADGIQTQSNRSGGVQGGISNGEELYFRVAFKPTATILQKQKTVSVNGEETELVGRGRHDPCVLPRAVPIVESMAAIVIVDHCMRQNAQRNSFSFSK